MMNETKASDSNIEVGDDVDLNLKLKRLKWVIILQSFLMNWKRVILSRSFFATSHFTCANKHLMMNGKYLVRRGYDPWRYLGLQSVGPTSWWKYFIYKLLPNVGPTFAYSHLVVASKFPMLLFTTQKGELRFSMIIEVRDALIVVVEERQSYEE